eukprot:726684-Pyramimonas_sp.AAC.1
MRLTAGPRNAISYNIAVQLKSIRFRSEFVEILAVSRAAHSRYFLRSRCPYGVLEDLEATREGLEHIPYRWHVGWNQASFLGFARRSRSWFSRLNLELSADTPKLQHQLYLAFRALQHSESVRHTILRRIRLLDLGLDMGRSDCFCNAIRRACSVSSMYVGVAPLRLITGS